MEKTTVTPVVFSRFTILLTDDDTWYEYHASGNITRYGFFNPQNGIVEYLTTKWLTYWNTSL